MTKRTVLLGLVVLFFSVTAKGQTTRPQAVTAAVKDQGVVGEFSYMPGSGHRLGILVLGGSEGGMPRYRSKVFVDAGYPTLTLSYLHDPGTFESIEQIPLEYFEKAIAWMQGSEKMKRDGIVIFGASKGAEAALLLGSRLSSVKGVIAMSPSSVVWQGLPKAYWPIPPALSSWSEGGKPLEFVPLDHSAPSDPNNLVVMYRRSLAKDPDVVARATIPVEKINGPILLLCGAEDRMWPDPAMAEGIVARLKEKNFGHSFELVTYPDAGHTLSEGYMIGGTSEGNKAAHEKSDAKMLEFLEGIEKGGGK